MTRSSLLGLALGGSLLIGSTNAIAQPSKDDVAKADTLFRDAQILVQKGQLAEGCAKFAESQKLDPANGTLLNLALCHEKDGKTATAYRELQELLTVMSGSKSADDRERTKVANERLKALDKKIPRLSFDVTALPKDASLALDGEKVSDPAFPALVDPGTHVVEATAPKKKPAKKTVEVRDPTTTVKLDPLEDDTPPVVAPPPPPPPPPAPPPPASFWTGQRIGGAALAGVGVAGVAVGAVFGLDTFSKKDERDKHCVGTVCDAEGFQLHEDAGTSATISSIAFGAGAALIAAGVILFVTGGPTEKSGAASRWRSLGTF